MGDLKREVKIGDWQFEVKMVMGRRDSKGTSSAVANLTFINDTVYVDSQLSSGEDNLTIPDYLALNEFCNRMGAKYITYDRIKNGRRMTKKLKIRDSTGHPRMLSGKDTESGDNEDW